MKQFPPSDDTPREGDLLPARGFGTLNDHHAPEREAEVLLGKGPRMADLTPEWIIERLMREATDYGSRTRQSARVAALKTLAEISQLTEAGVQRDDPVEKAMSLPPEERRRLIVQKTRDLVKRGVIKPEDLKHG